MDEPDYTKLNWFASRSKFATASDACLSYCLNHPDVKAQLATLTAERDKLKAMVVWAVLHGAEAEGDKMWWFRMLGEDSGTVDVECDGTPESILEAVGRAMGASSPAASSSPTP